MMEFNKKEMDAEKEFNKAIENIESIDVPDMDLKGVDELDFQAGNAFETAVDDQATDKLLEKNAQIVKLVYNKIESDFTIPKIKNTILVESMGTVFQASNELAEELAKAIAKRKFGKSLYDRMIKDGKKQGDPENDKPFEDTSEAIE